MSVLSTLADKDGWIEIEDPDETAGPNTAGRYEGENVNYGFRSSESGEQLQGDEYRRYQSGPYTVELRIADDGTRRVRVSQHDVEDREYNRKPYRKDDGTYEVYLPAPLVRHVGFDEVAFTETRTIRGEERETDIGILLELTLEWTSDGIRTVFSQVDESEADRSNVRRVQHKTNDEYDQFFVYFPKDCFSSLGIRDHTLTFSVDDGKIVADISRDATDPDGRRVSRCPNLASSPVSTREFLYESFEGNPNADVTLELSPERVISLVTAGEDDTRLRDYSEVPREHRLISPTTIGENVSGRLTLRTEQARALGLIPDRKVELVDTGIETAGAWFIEWTEYGLALVFHPDASKLGEEHDGTTTVSLGVNNWKEPVSSTDPTEERFDKARNQISVALPLRLGSPLGVFDREMYWWTAEDQCYGTDEPILVGLPSDQLPDGFHET